MIRKRGQYGHVLVTARAGHLIVKAKDSQGMEVPIARATPIGGREYRLSFHTHTGRWEPMPVAGGLEELTDILLGLLGPHIDRANLG